MAERPQVPCRVLAATLLTLAARRALVGAATCEAAPAGSDHSFIQLRGDLLQAEEKKYVLTWEVPPASVTAAGQQRRLINVTNAEARHATGPLTLLLALRLSAENGALKSFMSKARRTGRARIHLLGVKRALEARMLWERFLVGPLSARDRHLVDTFELPRTPLAGLRVSLLFNGDALSSDVPRHHRGAKFTEAQTPGLYHLSVKEVPDLVMAINPGFAHYVQNWWPTLRRLERLRVPILATGFGQSFSPGSALRALFRAGGPRERLRMKAVELYTPAGTLEGGSPTPGEGALGTVCSDREGNALVASEAGYAVRAVTRNPFVFCEASTTGHLNCQGSEVLSVLQPRWPRPRKHIPERAPSALVRKILRESLPCYPLYKRHRRCMEQRLRRGALPRKAGKYIDDFLDKMAEDCPEEEEEED